MGKVKAPGEKRGIGGRPTKIDEECISKLEDIFMHDGTTQEACKIAGISTVQYYERAKVDKEFANRMQRAQLYAFILAKKVLVKSMKSSNQTLAQRGAVEFLKRRDKRYSDKVDNNVKGNLGVEADVDVKADVDYKGMSMIELEEKRKGLLGFGK